VYNSFSNFFFYLKKNLKKNLKKKKALYYLINIKTMYFTDVLDNPLILENIFEHLDAKDALNLFITNAPFTKEERFLDTLDIFVKKKKK
jgi:hypothetical protein